MHYAIQIVLKEELDPRWVDWFEGLTLLPAPGGGTCLTGEVPDRSALHGILDRIRDLNLSLVEAQVIEKK